MADLSWLQTLQDYGSTWGEKAQTSVENIFNTAKDWLLEPRDEDIKDLHLHIYGNETMTLTADVTDNYVENNIAYQDHIALKPKVFTVSGEVGELTWFKNDKSNSIIGAVAQKLVPVVSFLPPISQKASSIQDKAMKIIGVVDSLDNFANRVWDLLSNDDVNTEQKKAYKYLMMLWKRRVPIDIRTPFGKISNYVIQSVEFTQPDRTVDKSQVKISFKEFKTVIEKRRRVDKNKLQGRKSAQQAGKQNKGTTSGVSLDYSECKSGSVFVDNETGRCVIVGGVGNATG